MRRATMFPNVNPLPCAKRHPPLMHRNAQVNRGERGADVRRHIVITFSRVNEKRITVADEPRKKTFQVAPHVRVRILLNQQRRRCVPQMQRKQSVFEIVLCNPATDIISEFVESAAPRRNGEILKSLPEHIWMGFAPRLVIVRFEPFLSRSSSFPFPDCAENRWQSLFHNASAPIRSRAAFA